MGRGRCSREVERMEVYAQVPHVSVLKWSGRGDEGRRVKVSAKLPRG